jgi:hypothetical protein
LVKTHDPELEPNAGGDSTKKAPGTDLGHSMVVETDARERNTGSPRERDD